MQYFQSFLEDCLDLEFVETDRLYVDIGKEKRNDNSTRSRRCMRRSDVVSRST
jgi:hypothetical protein